MIVDIFRDAAWEGIAAVITIFSVIIAIAFYLFPQMREGFRQFLFSNSRKLISIILLVIAFLLGIFLGQEILFNSSQESIEVNADPEKMGSFPLKLLERYDFEDAISPINTGPWEASTGIGNDTLIINTDSSYAFSGSNSLQLQTEILNRDDGDWTGIHSRGLPTEKIMLVSMWVYIPLNEQTMNRTFMGNLYLGAGLKYAYGQHFKISPGEWVQFTVGGVASMADKSSEQVAEIFFPNVAGLLDFQIWHQNAAYTGPIYIDNIELFGTK